MRSRLEVDFVATRLQKVTNLADDHSQVAGSSGTRGSGRGRWSDLQEQRSNGDDKGSVMAAQQK
jgi:hypothetical protein